MPTYLYKCKACQSPFAIERGMTESRADVCCPDCRSAEVARDFSGIQVRGGAAPQPAPVAAPRGGCGTSCGCHH